MLEVLRAQQGCQTSLGPQPSRDSPALLAEHHPPPSPATETCCLLQPLSLSIHHLVSIPSPAPLPPLPPTPLLPIPLFSLPPLSPLSSATQLPGTLSQPFPLWTSGSGTVLLGAHCQSTPVVTWQRPWLPSKPRVQGTDSRPRAPRGGGSALFWPLGYRPRVR